MSKIVIAIFFIFTQLFATHGQSIVINEVCSSNSIVLDEDNDSPDWIELYNTSTDSINLHNYTISDNSLELNKWKFPSLILSPNEVLLVFASAKDRSELSYYRSLISQGDTFSYTLGASTVPSDWKNAGFDDVNWSKGASGFGYGDNDDATLISTGTLSVFVRKTFQLSNLNNIKELLLHVDCDDGFVAYINGKEIARSNLGAVNTDVPYNQTANANREAVLIGGATPPLYSLQNFDDIIVEGENVLCLQVHNYSLSSGDLTLVPFLSVSYSIPINGKPVPEILHLKDKSLHTNFNISADGEKLFLLNAEGILIDQTDSISLPMNISYGRLPSNLNKWLYFAEPTPNFPNNVQGYDSLSSSAIKFSPTGGIFNGLVNLSLKSKVGSTIFYTTDGSDPSINSIKYSSSIPIAKTTVIRAMATDATTLYIAPAFETYIIENRVFNLPVVSLSTNPYNLFDFNYGIYEMGPNAEAGNPNFGANFWEDWERPINIEYFDEHGDKKFSATGGTKIFGAWSRANAQKSLALFARNEYGTKSFNYPFFKDRENDKYKALVLRNSGNDWDLTAIRDAMMTGLVRNVAVDRQAYQPVAVFINGDYWGLLNMREKVNEDFLADNHPGVDADKVDILEKDGEVVEGSAEHYNHMISYIKANDLSDSEIYDSVSKMMDVVNFMDYEIAQIYYGNGDWPGNNIKFWRSQTTIGKWRWILYDTDFGFDIGYGQLYGGYENNTLAFALEPNGSDWPNPPWSTFLLRSLLDNDYFKHEFINRFADRLNNEFKPAVVTHFIDSLKTNIEDEMPYHIERWNHIWGWEGNINHIKIFGIQRPNFMRDYINTEFSLGGIVNVTVDVSDKTEGVVQVNSLLLDKYPWSGNYFEKNTVPIVAIPNPGYEFSHWEGNASTSAYLMLSIPSTGVKLKAIFKESDIEYNSIVINEINYNSSDDANCGDWIELYNTTNANIDLSGWILTDTDDKNGYKLPLGTVISQKNYIVLSKESERFNNVFPSVANVVGGFDFGLSSSFDIVKLLNKNNVLIDSIGYFNEYPWPVISNNQTISLYTPYSDNAIGANWKSSVSNGTPGRANDFYVFVPESVISELAAEVSCFPNPTQGYSTMRWTNNFKQKVQINLYNINGELVKQIYNSSCSIGTFEETIFEEANYQDGIYFVQVIFGNGVSKTLKLVKI